MPQLHARARRIALMLAGLSCGIPGSLLLVWGLLAASVSFLPGAEVDLAGSTRPAVGFLAGILATALGLGLLAVSRRVGRMHAPS